MCEDSFSAQRLTQNDELRMGPALQIYRCSWGYLEYVVSRKGISENILGEE